MNGQKLDPDIGQAVSYTEKRYRLIPNVNFVEFDSHQKKPEDGSNHDHISSKNKNSSGEEERKLSRDDQSKDSFSLDHSQKSKGIERVKSDPGKIRTIKSMMTGQHFPDSTDSDEKTSEDGPVMAGKFGKPNPTNTKDSDDQTDNGENKRIKGGIIAEQDKYYHGNIHSERIEAYDGKFP